MAPVDVARKRFLSLRSPAGLPCPFCDARGYNLIVCGQASAYPGLADVCVVTHAVAGREVVCPASRAHLSACAPAVDAFAPKTFPASDRNVLLAQLHMTKPHRDFLGNLRSPDADDNHFVFSLLAAALHARSRLRDLKLHPGFVADYISKSSSTLLARILLSEGSERRMIADPTSKIWNTEHRGNKSAASINEKSIDLSLIHI